MTGAEPSVETQELSEKVLGLIGSYRMGPALNARDLFARNAADAPSADTLESQSSHTPQGDAERDR